MTLFVQGEYAQYGDKDYQDDLGVISVELDEIAGRIGILYSF